MIFSGGAAIGKPLFTKSRNIVNWDCIAKTKYKVLCIFMCVGLAGLEGGLHGIFSDGSGQTAPTGDEWESPAAWWGECSL